MTERTKNWLMFAAGVAVWIMLNGRAKAAALAVSASGGTNYGTATAEDVVAAQDLAFADSPDAFSTGPFVSDTGIANSVMEAIQGDRERQDALTIGWRL